MKGIIALDIDGTVTESYHDVHRETVVYLGSLIERGWHLLFITGRPYVWAHAVFDRFPFPFLAAVQNGAILLEMPGGNILRKHYVSSEVFERLQEICEEEKTDFVLYSGYEYEDIVYYRPERLSPKLLAYVLHRAETFGERWVPCTNYASCRPEGVASLKCFATQESGKRLEEKIHTRLGLHAPMISDRFGDEFFVIQATHPDATKGKIFAEVAEKKGIPKTHWIAAGDDFNDVGMLQEATERVVMATAPEELKRIATVVAPSAGEQGIIVGLEQAIQRIGAC